MSVGDVRNHDVSLYDHARTTAALAAALYRYHAESKSLTESAVRDETTSKFLLVHGDFYGIQEFIFSEGGESGKGRAKTLRGRSFMVSLLCELAAQAVCESLELPLTSILLNAAGRFTVVAQNTAAARESMVRLEAELNGWLAARFFGESAIGISLLEATATDFASAKGGFRRLWRRLLRESEKKKFSRMDSGRLLGPVRGYLDRFMNDLDPPVCPYCGKRPSVPAAMPRLLAGSRDSCAMCRDQVFLGKWVVSRDRRLAITKPGADIRGEASRLLEPLFGRYQVFFGHGDLSEMAQSGDLLRYWELRAPAATGTAPGSKRVAVREIGGYVPVYEKDDANETRFIEDGRSEGKVEQMLDEVAEGAAKSFLRLAWKAKVEEQGGSLRGLEALGVLKADVDNLGDLFDRGIPGDRVTLFGETVPWVELASLELVRTQLQRWLADGYVTTGMLHRFNAFQEMAGREALVRKASEVTMEDVESCLWRSRFKYTVARNTARSRKDLKEAERKGGRGSTWSRRVVRAARLGIEDSNLADSLRNQEVREGPWRSNSGKIVKRRFSGSTCSPSRRRRGPRRFLRTGAGTTTNRARFAVSTTRSCASSP